MNQFEIWANPTGDEILLIEAAETGSCHMVLRGRSKQSISPSFDPVVLLEVAQGQAVVLTDPQCQWSLERSQGHVRIALTEKGMAREFAILPERYVQGLEWLIARRQES